MAVPDWPLVAESGLILISFKTDPEIIGCGAGNAFDQSWLNVRYSGLNKYTTASQAIPYLNGCGLQTDPASRMLQLTPTH